MTSLAIGVDVLLVLGLVLAFSLSGRLLGPRPRHEGEADEPYETGMLPIEPAVDKMAVSYWRFAVLFVVFDVDLAFLMPWALTRRALEPQMVVCASVFVFLLLFMLAYFWRKGVLECN
jgi:NADH-quinone oxidoreductase subunit A